MKIESSHGSESVIVLYDSVKEFSQDLPLWLVERWTFHDARRDYGPKDVVRVQYMRNMTVEAEFLPQHVR